MGLAGPFRGDVVAAGVGGPITGHGAALGIIDDPFENWEQAQSERIRTRVWEGGVIMLMITRWQEQDLPVVSSSATAE